MPERKDIDLLFSVIAVTDNEIEAKNTVDIFLREYSDHEKTDIIKELGQKDKRFMGWEAKYVFYYDLENLSRGSLKVGREAADLIRSDRFDIVLTLIERL